MWIELASGVRVAGEVVWSRGSLVGVRFHRPLPTSLAIAFGLQKADAPAIAPKPDPQHEPATGFLRHWVRQLATRLR